MENINSLETTFQVVCTIKEDRFTSTLNPNLAAWLNQANTLQAKMIACGWKRTSVNIREAMSNITREFTKTIPEIPLVCDDYVITPSFEVPVRIYHPKPDTPLPVLIFFHGGGHLCGSVSVYDPLTRRLAQATKHIVVAPEYRLTPECPYPAGIVDSLGVTRRIWQTLDGRGIKYQRKLSIAGDSGGGAISATVSSRAQFDSDLEVSKQILIYPSVDYTLSFPSIQENGTGYFLETGVMLWYFNQYFRHEEDRKVASPLFLEFTENLPKTLVITAQFCPLRDEGIAYAEKVRAAGVNVQHINFEDMIHAFMNFESLVPEACQKLYTVIDKFLN